VARTLVVRDERISLKLKIFVSLLLIESFKAEACHTGKYVALLHWNWQQDGIGGSNVPLVV
jgi:hypothetical protein